MKVFMTMFYQTLNREQRNDYGGLMTCPGDLESENESTECWISREKELRKQHLSDNGY